MEQKTKEIDKISQHHNNHHHHVHWGNPIEFLMTCVGMIIHYIVIHLQIAY